MSFLPLFSHIYVEEEALTYPLAKQLIDRFSKSEIVTISNYKEVFNRPRQRWDHQKNVLNLILAVRKENFLYEGSQFVPDFGQSRFYYNTPVLNCLYGCEYCYLQGMFPSANVVVFVNIEDFVSHAVTQIAGEPTYLCVSYDTDLLALEDLLHYSKRWIRFCRENPHVTLELRTKSANFRAIQDEPPVSNLVLAWTLSPKDVTSRFEHRTPSLDARLASIRAAMDAGFLVRICFDPILLIEDWENQYGSCVDHVFSTIDGTRVHDVSIGVFRITSGYLREMQESSPASALINYRYSISNGAASYTEEQRQMLLHFMSERVKQYVPEEKVCPIKWQL